MRRRRLLALLAGSAGTLSGCTGVGELRDGSTDDDLGGLTPAPVPDPTERPATETAQSDGPGFDLSYIADFEAANRRIALPTRSVRILPDSRLDVGFEGSPDAGDAVLLRGRLSTESARGTTVGLTSLAPFAGDFVAKHAGDSDATITLVPTRNDGLAGEDLPTEGVDAGACRADAEELAAVYPDAASVEPGDVVSMEFRVCPGAAGSPLPTGRYRFESDRSGGFGPTQFVVWDRTEPGPSEPSTLADPTPPSFSEREVTWFHEAGPTSTVWYRPSEERVTPPTTVDFTLFNRSAAPIPAPPDRPRLFKLVDESWHPIGRRVSPFVRDFHRSDGFSFPPGRTATETLCLANDAGNDCGDDVPAVGHLGGGRYGAVVDIGSRGRSWGAVLDLDAPPVTVEPSEGVTVLERRGSTVVVGTDDVATSEGESAGMEVVVTRIDAAERRLIPEQVMQPSGRALRDTLPFFEFGIDRVKLRAESGPLRYEYPVGEFSRRFVFDGVAYEVQIDR